MGEINFFLKQKKTTTTGNKREKFMTRNEFPDRLSFIIHKLILIYFIWIVLYIFFWSSFYYVDAFQFFIPQLA